MVNLALVTRQFRLSYAFRAVLARIFHQAAHSFSGSYLFSFNFITRLERCGGDTVHWPRSRMSFAPVRVRARSTIGRAMIPFMRGAGSSRSPAESFHARGARSRSPAEPVFMRGAGPSRSPAEGSSRVRARAQNPARHSRPSVQYAGSPDLFMNRSG